VFPASLLRDLADSLCAVVFPSQCRICGCELAHAGWTSVCGDCWSSIEPWTGPQCARCGLPFASGLGFEADASEPAPDETTILCSVCRREEYDFDLARSYGLYQGPLRAAILELKFHRQERLGLRLGKLLASMWDAVEGSIQDDQLGPPVIVPLPLHPARQRERGYNQSRLLAQGLVDAMSRRRSPASAVEVRLEDRCVRRRRSTAPQSGLSLSARQQNVRGAFVVSSPGRLRDRRVILVDDVMTTGATASACAAALKRAGVRQVVVLTLARATPQFPDLFLSPRDLTVDDLGRDSQ